jgi:hypothetical protein
VKTTAGQCENLMECWLFSADTRPSLTSGKNLSARQIKWMVTYQETRQAKSVKPGNSIGRVDRGEISISEQECVACEITKPKIDERSGADRKLQVGKNKSDAWKNQSNLTAPARFRNATEETKIAAPKRTENESVRMNSDMGKNNKHPTKKQKQIFYCTLIRLQLIHRGHNSHSLIWLKIK